LFAAQKELSFLRSQRSEDSLMTAELREALEVITRDRDQMRKEVAEMKVDIQTLKTNLESRILENQTLYSGKTKFQEPNAHLSEELEKKTSCLLSTIRDLQAAGEAIKTLEAAVEKATTRLQSLEHALIGFVQQRITGNPTAISSADDAAQWLFSSHDISENLVRLLTSTLKDADLVHATEVKALRERIESLQTQNDRFTLLAKGKSAPKEFLCSFMELKGEPTEHLRRLLVEAGIIIELSRIDHSLHTMIIGLAKTLLASLTSSIGLRVSHLASGCIVTSVTDGGAAHFAGIRPGHKILRLNGVSTHSSAELMRVIGNVYPGDRVSAEVDLGGGRETEVSLVVRVREVDFDAVTILALRRVAYGGVQMESDLALVAALRTTFPHEPWPATVPLPAAAGTSESLHAAASNSNTELSNPELGQSLSVLAPPSPKPSPASVTTSPIHFLDDLEHVHRTTSEKIKFFENAICADGKSSPKHSPSPKRATLDSPSPKRATLDSPSPKRATLYASSAPSVSKRTLASQTPHRIASARGTTPLAKPLRDSPLFQRDNQVAEGKKLAVHAFGHRTPKLGSIITKPERKRQDIKF